jgi:hypothetical protein
MANTQAMCTSFKGELLTGTHNFGTAPLRASTAADTFKAAIYLASATVNAATAAYSSTGEVTGTNYTAGGTTVTNATAPTTSGTTGYWTPSASFSWSNVTLASSFDAVLLYNSTQSNKAVSVHTFTAQTVLAGNFTLTMPTNNSSNALIRLA